MARFALWTGLHLFACPLLAAARDPSILQRGLATNGLLASSGSYSGNDQYLQLTSSLPYGTNIYGLGEVIASSGFRRDIGTGGGVGTLQTMWDRDDPDPIDENMYGSHPIYLEHRYNETTGKSSSHGVMLFSSSGADILLSTPQSEKNVSLIEYRLVGGVLDFYFFAGPSPTEVIAQYSAVTGLANWQPAWGFGFHLCRWGYHNISITRDQVLRMREANIPLETQWNDIDLYHAYRDFTSDPVSFPGDEMREFIEELASNNQHYIPIVDAGVAILNNATDVYYPYSRGSELDVFVKNPDGSEYIGQVWPGYTVFGDWFANNTQQWWSEALRNWSNYGIEFSGIWLDMNEVSSFCNGSCGTGANTADTGVPIEIPGQPGNLVTGYPECYNSTLSGPSGNMTINGTLTYACGIAGAEGALAKRGIGAGEETGVNLNDPPYAIHNSFGPLWVKTLATNATHAGGYVELDVHNMWGMMEEKATHAAVSEIRAGERPFLISRSTFPSSGRWSGHWGVLQFQIYQIPFVGADTCGFQDNTDEELCNRWMQMSAFVPFYRNHNTLGALSQEPYRWPSVANASRIAIAARYSMLPYWLTLFANVSTIGTPPVRALFYEFPDEPELFEVDRQFMVGPDILVTPVLTPNATTVDGIFPGRGTVVWRDWWTHDVVNATVGGNTTLSAPLSHINVHIRDHSALLLHAEPAYTIAETRAGPYALLISLDTAGTAFGNAYVDDGISSPPGPSTVLTFTVANGELNVKSEGAWAIEQMLEEITVLGVQAKPTEVTLGGAPVEGWTYDEGQEGLTFSNISVDLNESSMLAWK
ncbi:glycoside hydrolase family 31 protein [Serpula lacrymans var. lacrymans S7.3]|uniref:Glycoside hydrolase family 31 protein n=1 Tax=Serpula lacrymans var. lacrymans (strain S7.3) TaxID=936435 RepID=F8QBS6_SERL3|nr:glycoside hydrolase family 31 protein [Serpula lacrymans var. lacrymans S7.3]